MTRPGLTAGALGPPDQAAFEASSSDDEARLLQRRAIHDSAARVTVRISIQRRPEGGCQCETKVSANVDQSQWQKSDSQQLVCVCVFERAHLSPPRLPANSLPPPLIPLPTRIHPDVKRPGREVEPFEGQELAQRHSVNDARGAIDRELQQRLQGGQRLG